MTKFSTSKLANGLEILAIPDENAPSVAMVALYRVGSRHEEDKQAGIAHFLEHSLFKGSKLFPTSKDIGMEIELLGGSSNAFTSYDYTGYYIKVPKKTAGEAFFVFSDMIQNPIFDENEIEKERGVIVEEIRMYSDEPQSRVADMFNSNLFYNHPLGRDIAGSIKTVEGIDASKLRAFMQKSYNSDSMLLIVSGNFSEKQLSEWANHFSNMPKGFCPKFETYDPDVKPNKRVITEVKELEQTHMVIGGIGVSRNDPDRFAFRVGNSLLSYGFGSRLFQKIRDELGLAYYVGLGISSYDDAGKFMIRIGSDTKRAKAAINATLQELKEVICGNFSDKELNRAKSYLIGNISTELEATDDSAMWYGMQQLLRREILTPDEIQSKIDAVQKSDIIRAWSRIIFEDNLFLASLGPDSSGISEEFEMKL